MSKAGDILDAGLFQRRTGDRGDADREDPAQRPRGGIAVTTTSSRALSLDPPAVAVVVVVVGSGAAMAGAPYKALSTAAVSDDIAAELTASHRGGRLGGVALGDVSSYT